MENNCIIAIVGMPGAGKSEAINYIKGKGIPCIRFGDITEEGLKKAGLAITPENEKTFRENLREKLGMAAYALESKPKIDNLLQEEKIVAIDGLYSWEEYITLKKEYASLKVIAVVANAEVRYERLGKRSVRPLTLTEAKERDIAEIEKLDKGGPLAIADYYIENNSESVEDLHQKIEKELQHII